eukprot:TRINITY_DN1082_c0_g1_i9.p1 TRINITY_DN1082_c0_g1~~TRINITY_DN1082_c0_g1_i9.p1  ORF type:complete len:635 (-),score=115.04 TRINITY_DN1082_c0_g1_i9:1084-2958(-)
MDEDEDDGRDDDDDGGVEQQPRVSARFPALATLHQPPLTTCTLGHRPYPSWHSLSRTAAGGPETHAEDDAGAAAGSEAGDEEEKNDAEKTAAQWKDKATFRLVVCGKEPELLVANAACEWDEAAVEQRPSKSQHLTQQMRFLRANDGLCNVPEYIVAPVVQEEINRVGAEQMTGCYLRNRLACCQWRGNPILCYPSGANFENLNVCIVTLSTGEHSAQLTLNLAKTGTADAAARLPYSASFVVGQQITQICVSGQLSFGEWSPAQCDDHRPLFIVARTDHSCFLFALEGDFSASGSSDTSLPLRALKKVTFDARVCDVAVAQYGSGGAFPTVAVICSDASIYSWEPLPDDVPPEEAEGELRCLKQKQKAEADRAEEGDSTRASKGKYSSSTQALSTVLHELRLICFGAHPRQLLTATSWKVNSLDLTCVAVTKERIVNIGNRLPKTRITAIARHPSLPCLFVVATVTVVRLYDHRSTLTPLLEWDNLDSEPVSFVMFTNVCRADLFNSVITAGSDTGLLAYHYIMPLSVPTKNMAPVVTGPQPVGIPQQLLRPMDTKHRFPVRAALSNSASCVGAASMGCGCNCAALLLDDRGDVWCRCVASHAGPPVLIWINQLFGQAVSRTK